MQLLSSSSALAVSRYMEQEEEARFLRTIDDGFDVLNSGHPSDIKVLRRGYSGKAEQEAALSALVKEATQLRVGKARHLYPFQKGILVTVRSVRGLLADLQSKFGDDTYLLTRHLTQDRLEGFFGLVRGCGGSNPNPTPTEAKSRLRLLTILMLTQHGVSPLCMDSKSSDGAVEEATEPSEPLADQLSELHRECDDEEQDPLPDDIERLVPHEVPEDEAHVDDEVEAELEALLEAERGAGPGPGQPPKSSGAVDSQTGVSASDSAMAYVAGYVARKRGPSLGAPSAYAEEVPVEALWTRLRSVGGLTIPTQQFFDEFRQTEAEFCAHHAMEPDGLSRRPGVITELVGILTGRHPNLTRQVIQTFVRVRTFIRLRHVNAGRRMESLAKRTKRKQKHFAQ